MLSTFDTSYYCSLNKTFSTLGYSDTSFLATFETSLVITSDPIVFNYPVHNTGGHYDPTTGIYTVPLDGTYEFIFHFWGFNDVTVGALLVVDSDAVSLFSKTVIFNTMWN